MIRQATARGVLESWKEKCAPKQQQCIDNLKDLINKLLPSSKPKHVNPGVTKFVEKAIELKNAMTEEQAVYRFYLIDFGQPVNDSILNIEDEGCVDGNMLMCTFPGLQRFVINEGVKEKLTVVKASGELQRDMSQSSSSQNEGQKTEEEKSNVKV